MAKGRTTRKPKGEEGAARRLGPRPVEVTENALREAGVKRMEIIQLPDGSMRYRAGGFTDGYQLTGWIHTHVRPDSVMKGLLAQVQRGKAGRNGAAD